MFPTEKCGAAGDDFKPSVYGTDPAAPIGDWKEAWEAARERAGVPAASTISGIPRARECLRRARPSRLWQRSGLESIDNCEDVTALRPHWAGRTEGSGQGS